MPGRPVSDLGEQHCRICAKAFAPNVKERSVGEPRDGGAEVGLCRVPEFADERMACERLLHDAALHALPATVNQTDLVKPGGVGGGHIFLDDRGDIARGKRVEIERAVDRDAMRHQRTMPPCTSR